MRAFLVPAVALLVVAGAGCRSHGAGPAQKATLPGLTPQRLAALRAGAIRAAAMMGESRPRDGIVVATTQHAVFRAEPHGPRVYGPDFKVYVVAFSGRLTAYRVSRPPGARPRRGGFAYAIHRADTLAVTDFGLLEKPFDLEHLGPHVPLGLQDAERQRAVVYTELYLDAGNAPPFDHRVSRASRVRRGLWQVEVRAARAPGAGGRVRYGCFTIRLDRFYVRTGATDDVSSRGIEARSGRCPS